MEPIYFTAIEPLHHRTSYSHSLLLWISLHHCPAGLDFATNETIATKETECCHQEPQFIQELLRII